MIRFESTLSLRGDQRWYLMNLNGNVGNEMVGMDMMEVKRSVRAIHECERCQRMKIEIKK